MQIEIDDGLIEQLKKACKESGYGLPETEGWSDIIQDMVEENITEDFGIVVGEMKRRFDEKEQKGRIEKV